MLHSSETMKSNKSTQTLAFLVFSLDEQYPTLDGVASWKLAASPKPQVLCSWTFPHSFKPTFGFFLDFTYQLTFACIYVCQLLCLPYLPSTLFFAIGSLPWNALIGLTKWLEANSVKISFSSSALLSSLRMPGLQTSAAMQRCFQWVLGIQTQVLQLAGQVLYWPSHLLSPQIQLIWLKILDIWHVGLCSI